MPTSWRARTYCSCPALRSFARSLRGSALAGEVHIGGEPLEAFEVSVKLFLVRRRCPLEREPDAAFTVGCHRAQPHHARFGRDRTDATRELEANLRYGFFFRECIALKERAIGAHVREMLAFQRLCYAFHTGSFCPINSRFLRANACDEALATRV